MWRRLAAPTYSPGSPASRATARVPLQTCHAAPGWTRRCPDATDTSPLHPWTRGLRGFRLLRRTTRNRHSWLGRCRAQKRPPTPCPNRCPAWGRRPSPESKPPTSSLPGVASSDGVRQRSACPSATRQVLTEMFDIRPEINGICLPSAYGELGTCAGCHILSAIFCARSEGAVKIEPSKVRHLCPDVRFPPKI